MELSSRMHITNLADLFGETCASSSTGPCLQSVVRLCLSAASHADALGEPVRPVAGLHVCHGGFSAHKDTAQARQRA